MNIDTSSSTAATATAVSSASTSTSSVQSSSKSSKSDSSSFKDEIKSASEEQPTEKAETDTKADTAETEKADAHTKENSDKNDTNHMDSDTLKAELSYNDLQLNNDNQSLLNRNIQSLINTSDRMSFNNTDFSDLTASLDYQTVSMDINDAMFFNNLVQNTDMSMQSVASNFQQMTEVNVQAAEKTANVSSTLMNLMSESLKNNQPFRIDFDKDISVIIKVSKDGSIMANFIPGDKAVEEYLKNNIGSLRQRFDDENLAYSQLSYSKHKQEQEQNHNKKEKDDE